MYKTPMSMEEIKSWDGRANKFEIHEYQKRICSLSYDAIVSKLDIVKASQYLAEV